MQRDCKLRHMRAAASKFKNVQTSFCVLGSAVTSRLARATQQQPPKAAKGVVDGELGELVIIMYLLVYLAQNPTPA